MWANVLFSSDIYFTVLRYQQMSKCQTTVIIFYLYIVLWGSTDVDMIV